MIDTRNGIPAGSRFLLALALLLGLATAGCWIEHHPKGEAGGQDGDPGTAAGPSESNLWSQVDADLDSSAAAWNRGELEEFLASYRRRPTTTYIGSSGLVIGYEGIRSRYAPLFEAGADRDSLRFRDLRVRPLGDSTALAIGRYVLHRADSVTSTGIFTLVLRRTGGDWMIVHDHSSALEPGER